MVKIRVFLDIFLDISRKNDKAELMNNELCLVTIINSKTNKKFNPDIFPLFPRTLCIGNQTLLPTGYVSSAHSLKKKTEVGWVLTLGKYEKDIYNDISHMQ
jgi:hypothetical protein